MLGILFSVLLWVFSSFLRALVNLVIHFDLLVLQSILTFLYLSILPTFILNLAHSRSDHFSINNVDGPDNSGKVNSRCSVHVGTWNDVEWKQIWQYQLSYSQSRSKLRIQFQKLVLPFSWQVVLHRQNRK